MLNIFQTKNNHLLRIDEKNIIFSLNEIIWIDIVTTHDNREIHYIQNIFKKNNQKFFEIENIKNNKTCFKNTYELHLLSYFLSYNKEQKKIKNYIVRFVIYDNYLFTIHTEKISTLLLYQKSIDNKSIIHNNVYELLLNLFETKLDDIINEIEHIYDTLEKLSLVIINEQQIDEYNNTLSNLADLENIGWKIRINLLNTERTINFLINKVKLPTLQKQYANKILKDIILLLPHNKYISHKINLLIHTVMGFIHIKQNKIIKIFSIIFLPPTLIASSYGMNFEFMPELHWPFGYPSAIILMILTGIAPYFYFKYKNWL